MNYFGVELFNSTLCNIVFKILKWNRPYTRGCNDYCITSDLGPSLAISINNLY